MNHDGNGLSSSIGNKKRAIKSLTDHRIKYNLPDFDEEVARLLIKDYKIKQRKNKENEILVKRSMNNLDKSRL